MSWTLVRPLLAPSPQFLQDERILAGLAQVTLNLLVRPYYETPSAPLGHVPPSRADATYRLSPVAWLSPPTRRFTTSSCSAPRCLAGSCSSVRHCLFVFSVWHGRDTVPDSDQSPRQMRWTKYMSAAVCANGVICHLQTRIRPAAKSPPLRTCTTTPNKSGESATHASSPKKNVLPLPPPHTPKLPLNRCSPRWSGSRVRQLLGYIEAFRQRGLVKHKAAFAVEHASPR